MASSLLQSSFSAAPLHSSVHFERVVREDLAALDSVCSRCAVVRQYSCRCSVQVEAGLVALEEDVQMSRQFERDCGRVWVGYVRTSHHAHQWAGRVLALLGSLPPDLVLACVP